MTMRNKIKSFSTDAPDMTRIYGETVSGQLNR